MDEAAKALAIVLVCAFTVGCEAVNEHAVANYSTDQLCDYSSPKWAMTPEAGYAIRDEIARRGVLCFDGKVTDYGRASASGKPQN